MTTRMLIDARHPEETRVAVLSGNRIDEFDFDSAEHKQIKGNIYLAKVTRVEPSLQAAFVDFGGNRHGFLAFSEIHPDYYQIPKADRDALLAEEAAHAAEEEALRAAEEEAEEHDDHPHDDDDDHGVMEVDTSEKDQIATLEDGHIENGFDHAAEEAREGEAIGQAYEGEAVEPGEEGLAGDEGQSRGRGRGRRRQGRGRAKEASDKAEALRDKRMALRRRYKIQDVIQRRQVLLVQVVKEERGNKGAALTTYLSLAGRYCVLMPNSSHGGGISRKISSVADRKRLKSIISDLGLPKSMGCIVRTAGLSRTKVEIKRDFDYLARLWDEIRENTLKSSAPAQIHSDSDLIKRAIRDIYNREIDEVVVEGDQGYRDARDFMKLLMPSHVKKVKHYADPVPMFQRYGAEDQLSALYDPVVQLRSGGYLVINPTEALVSIDINSGRSTKEHGIEATALNTNLEAAREIARQLRLRDMAGLVVIDFIDMDYGSNIRKVEKAMKDALKNDRARIQVGRISSFGLMEMSRQRLRTGVLEASTRQCPHCDGTGLVRTAASSGLSALRLIEEEAARGHGSLISLYASTEAAVYLLNSKRADLAEIEARYGVRVEVLPEGENEGAKMRVTASGPRPEFVPVFEPIVEEASDEVFDDEDIDEEASEDSRDGEDGRNGRRKRRRGGRGRDRNRSDRDDAGETGDSDDAEAESSRAEGDEGEHDADGEPRKRRRRSRRRRGGRDRETAEQSEAEHAGEPEAEVVTEAAPLEAEAPAEKPKRGRRKKVDAEAEAPLETPLETPVEAPAETPSAADSAEPEAPAKPKRGRAKKVVEAVAAEVPVAETETGAEEKPKRGRKKKAEAEAEAETEAAPQEDAAPRRSGWWQRTFGE